MIEKIVLSADAAFRRPRTCKPRNAPRPTGYPWSRSRSCQLYVALTQNRRWRPLKSAIALPKKHSRRILSIYIRQPPLHAVMPAASAIEPGEHAGHVGAGNRILL